VTALDQRATVRGDEPAPTGSRSSTTTTHSDRRTSRRSAEADVVYPWFHLPTGVDPLFVHRNGELVPAFGVPFGDEQLNHLLTQGNFIPVTVLVRRAWLEFVDGFPTPGTARWPHAECEDWGCWQDLARYGARFKHVPERTWTWRWHGLNTSGKPWRRP
jgi:hypothetical protein